MHWRAAFATVLATSAIGVGTPQDAAFQIFQTMNGRYHCSGTWRDFQITIIPGRNPLGVVDPDSGITALITVWFTRSAASRDGAIYNLAGTYDHPSGRFHLEPRGWRTPNPPPGLEMVGIDGVFDANQELLTGKALSPNCDALQFAPAHKALPPSPESDAADKATMDARHESRPEKKSTPTNVTNYLDVASYSPDFEYWMTAWSDPPGTLHNGPPIDEENDKLKHDNLICAGSQRVGWDATGKNGLATNTVLVNERFVIECVGECRGMTYRPVGGGNVTHFGLSMPLPTLQIKSLTLGGVTTQWRFSRASASSGPPDVYIHRWKPLYGLGPIDPGPAEAARQKAAAPPCKAPPSR